MRLLLFALAATYFRLLSSKFLSSLDSPFHINHLYHSFASCLHQHHLHH